MGSGPGKPLSPLSFLEETKEGIIIRVRVSPGSSHFGVKRINPWTGELEVRLENQPVKGKANQELEEKLCQEFGLSVRVIAGKTSSRKKLLVEGTRKELGKALQPYL